MNRHKNECTEMNIRGSGTSLQSFRKTKKKRGLRSSEGNSKTVAGGKKKNQESRLSSTIIRANTRL